jgi:hypothetical protein
MVGFSGIPGGYPLIWWGGPLSENRPDAGSQLGQTAAEAT